MDENWPLDGVKRLKSVEIMDHIQIACGFAGDRAHEPLFPSLSSANHNLPPPLEPFIIKKEEKFINAPDGSPAYPPKVEHLAYKRRMVDGQQRENDGSTAVMYISK